VAKSTVPRSVEYPRDHLLQEGACDLDAHVHEHPHAHELQDHTHPREYLHEHPHEHLDEALALKNVQRSLRAESRGAVRALLAVIEVGNVNSEQRKAIHAVRVIIGDSHGVSCPHTNVVYEVGDVLICQDCQEVIVEAGKSR